MDKPLIPYQPHPSHIELMVIDDITFIPRHIVCAAICFDDLIVVGVRHYDDFMREQIEDAKNNGTLVKLNRAKEEQGFIDQYGQFVNRTDASYIVVMNKQQLRDSNIKIGDELFSKNLY